MYTMRTILLSAAFLGALMAGPVGTAEASYYLHFTGFLFGTGQSVSVNVEGTNYNNIGLGPVTGWRALTSSPAPSEKIYFDHPLYCLDIYHSFTWGDSWWADPILVPPYPTPPPHNTAEAAWIYQTYGNGSLSATEAKGVQLALWEVSHEAAWRDVYQQGNQTWAAGGDFYVTGGDVAVAKTYATGILDDLVVENPDFLDEHATYWKPVTVRETGRQGMLGDTPEIPEPSTLALAGAALLVAAGFGWRRRVRK